MAFCPCHNDGRWADHGWLSQKRVALYHVKPYGVLYNQAADEMIPASAIANAVKRFSVDLILVGQAGSSLIEAGVEAGLRVANEGFPDRNYNPSGTLVPRKQGNAIIELPEEASAHAVELAKNGIDFGGQRVMIDTVCIHGDHPQAIQNAKQVRKRCKKPE